MSPPVIPGLTRDPYSIINIDSDFRQDDIFMYYTYILASKRNGTLYVGVTSNLIHRIHQHKTGTVAGFTKKYKVNLLVYYEETEDINSGIAREKQLKTWKRQWKIDLIEKNNPNWKDLYPEIIS